MALLVIPILKELLGYYTVVNEGILSFAVNLKS